MTSISSRPWLLKFSFLFSWFESKFSIVVFIFHLFRIFCQMSSGFKILDLLVSRKVDSPSFITGLGQICVYFMLMYDYGPLNFWYFFSSMSKVNWYEFWLVVFNWYEFWLIFSNLQLAFLSWISHLESPYWSLCSPFWMQLSNQSC